MAPDRWQKAKDIFGAAIELEPSQREAYVRKAANGDIDLLAEVMSLLEKDSKETFFKNPIAPSPVTTVLLEGRYRLESEIGRGGFGVVYLARDQKLDGRRVVIKMLLSESSSDAWASEKFADEIRALARIDHPGVVGALDRGNCPDGRPFFVMQFVEGRPLRQEIAAGGIPLARVADISAQMGRALGAAHKGGVWHRDLKPENIMLHPLPEGGDQVRLIDFGIATIKDAHDSAREIQTRAVGSLSYMAPEQLSGHVTQATDLYAFSLIVYEMLTGCKPFAATSPGELLAQQKAGIFTKPSNFRPEVPPAAETLIFQGLRYDPQDRPPDAASFGDQLAQALTPAGSRSPVSRRSVLLMSICLAIAAALSATAWWLAHPPPPAPSLTYSLLIQKTRNGEPVGPPKFLSSDQVLKTSDSFLLLVRTTTRGHLYLLSEEVGKDSVNVLFPAPFMYKGSSLVDVGDLKRIPEQSSFAFDREPDVLVLWMIWSTDEIKQFEDLQKWMNERYRGALDDPGERSVVRSTLARLPQAVAIPNAGRSGEAVKSSASRFAFKIRLETRP